MAIRTTDTYPRFGVAADLVILAIRDSELQVLLVRRGVAPHAGEWALPGGFVHDDEASETAARRELATETGIDPGRAHLEQLATYSEPNRDPRGRVVSIAYLALLRFAAEPQAGSDASEAAWTPFGRIEDRRTELAFDHDRIVRDGVERARSKLEYSTVGAALCDAEFTVAELRHVYEAVWCQTLDPRNFHRKVTHADDFIRPMARTTTRNGGRPAQLYRAGKARLLFPPLLRDGHATTPTDVDAPALRQ